MRVLDGETDPERRLVLILIEALRDEADRLTSGHVWASFPAYAAMLPLSDERLK